MFRRNPETTDATKDSLFDTTKQGGTMSGDNIVTATTASAAPAAASSTLASATASSAAAPAARTETRTSSTPAGTTFRPSASPMSSMGGNDMARSRMPEAKPSAASVNSGIDKTKAGRRVLTVGNDILLKGEIATCDRLVIEGKVDATLNDVHTVEIAETGSFKGSANIEDAEISGLFEGDLVVRNRLVIYATGKVRGKISYGEIEIERGGELTGEIKTTNPLANSTTPRPTRTGVKVDEKVAA